MLPSVIYRFAEFELDLARVELRARGAVCALEPQVFALLALLIENRDRLVSRDEILEKIWDGRVVSDAALASRIKSARQALGDDGKSPAVHSHPPWPGLAFRRRRACRSRGCDDRRGGRAGRLGRGWRPAAHALSVLAKPSIAVLPFRLVGDAGAHAAIAEALPDELIIDLARLRWLFVTARGSSFRLRAADADMADIGRLLGVRYVLAGSVEVRGRNSPFRSSSRTRATPASSGRNASAARWPTSTASGMRSGSACWPRSKCASRSTRRRSRD